MCCVRSESCIKPQLSLGFLQRVLVVFSRLRLIWACRGQKTNFYHLFSKSSGALKKWSKFNFEGAQYTSEYTQVGSKSRNFSKFGHFEGLFGQFFKVMVFQDIFCPFLAIFGDKFQLLGKFFEKNYCPGLPHILFLVFSGLKTEKQPIIAQKSL